MIVVDVLGWLLLDCVYCVLFDFNVLYVGDYVLIVWVLVGCVGVDIEGCNCVVDWCVLMCEVCVFVEVVYFDSLLGGMCECEFMWVWFVKEVLFKVFGIGIVGGLCVFVVVLLCDVMMFVMMIVELVVFVVGVVVFDVVWFDVVFGYVVCVVWMCV